ncbi:MAG: type II toxin-antitoxin system VapC family toxin [Terrimicrobiaceae bacterium]|nr:type II toxin-antitoxin system VapC family toxin [Terrimicrobiaceae bacterium]
MARRILDSWALIAFFEDEYPAVTAAVAGMLDSASRGTDQLAMSIVNWGEIYYTVMREVSQQSADEHAAKIASLPIELVPADRALTQLAATFKARHRISYADAFAAALAKERKAEVVTGDPEFKALKGEIAIHWLK